MADRKFRLIAEETLGTECTAALVEKLHALETLEDVNQLFDRPAGPGV